MRDRVLEKVPHHRARSGEYSELKWPRSLTVRAAPSAVSTALLRRPRCRSSSTSTQNYLSGMVKRKPGFRELEPALRGVADDRDAVEAEFVEHRQQVAFVIRITVRVVVLAESVTAEVERDYPRAGEKRTTRSQYPALQDVGVAYCVTDTRTEYRSQGSSSSGSVLLHNPRDQAIVRVRGLNQHDKR